MTFLGGTTRADPPPARVALSPHAPAVGREPQRLAAPLNRCLGYVRSCGVWTSHRYCNFCEWSRFLATGLATDRPIFEDRVGLRFCRKCQEWWPDDAEFFYMHPSRKQRPFRVCKACAAERRRRLRAAA